MSNINNKHIPEDLDSLTRKDMVELFKIQIEEHQGFIKEIESLRTQLTKEREAVRLLGDSNIELSRRVGVTSNMFNDAVSNCNQLQEQLAKANERADELLARVGKAEARLASAAITGSGAFPSEALNKFAIENQCKAISVFATAFIKSNYKHDVPVMGRVYNEKMREAILNALQKSAEKSIKQLRKEKEHG